MLDTQRVYQLLQTGCWYRNSNEQGCFSLGRQRFNMGYACGKTTLTIHFDTKTCEFVCQVSDSDITDLFTTLTPPFAFQPVRQRSLTLA